MNPWEQVGAALAEAKRQGLTWDRAWERAMRTLTPERTSGYGPLVRKGLEEERDLQKELAPFYRAAYEDREVTAAEFERVSVETEKRLDSEMALA